MPIPELNLIKRIRRMAGASSRGGRGAVARGIGDDCAVLRLGGRFDTLVTTDMCVEGVHFRRDWYPAGQIGRQCLTRGLSDIAAMGGEPVAAFLSLALPAKLPQAWVDGCVEGLVEQAREFKVTHGDGDVSTSTSAVVTSLVRWGR